MATTAQDIARNQIAQGQAVIEQVRTKMGKLVDEFARGDISREQFNQVYEHYQSQIVMATQLMIDADAMKGMTITPQETFAIKSALSAKAKAMTVYYHATGLLLEIIGDFDVPVAHISQKLNDLSEKVSAGQKVETQAEKRGDQWLLYVPGKYSTTVMLVLHEPAARQIGIIETMHRDFELANEVALRSGHADGASLVYPFQSFVRKSVQRKV
ncbi:MAG TPA: hypothetical protein VKQ72_06380 [Aggregatilineales bacterium]|nr:hypothetical protein [Aggregatilineales bacterium]